jgi:hypothetical protein
MVLPVKRDFGTTEKENIRLADCVIRIMDYAYAKNLNLAKAMFAKIAYNEGRPRKHGKLF